MLITFKLAPEWNVQDYFEPNFPFTSHNNMIYGGYGNYSRNPVSLFERAPGDVVIMKHHGKCFYRYEVHSYQELFSLMTSSTLYSVTFLATPAQAKKTH